MKEKFAVHARSEDWVLGMKFHTCRGDHDVRDVGYPGKIGGASLGEL